MSQNLDMVTLTNEYSKRIVKLRHKIRRKVKSVLEEVFEQEGRMQRDALRLKNVYYLDYDPHDDEMLWVGFDHKDKDDKKDYETLRSYFKGCHNLYQEMHLSKLPLKRGYLRWCIQKKEAGYAVDANADDSVNPKLDSKLGYRSCIHIPFSPRHGDRRTVPIGDIILAHRDKDGLLGHFHQNQKQRIAKIIAEKLYKACDLQHEFQRINEIYKFRKPIWNSFRKRFSYYYDQTLRDQYYEAVFEYLKSCDARAQKRPLSCFLVRLNNFLNGAKQGILPIDNMLKELYADATPLVNWVTFLSSSEKMLSGIIHYREHLWHITNVFMLGIVALNTSYITFVNERIMYHLGKLPDNAGAKLWPSQELIMTSWAIIAFSHDTLYLLEKGSPAVDTLNYSFAEDISTKKAAEEIKSKISNNIFSSHRFGNLLPAAKFLVTMEKIHNDKSVKTASKYEERVTRTMCGILKNYSRHDSLAGMALESELRIALNQKCSGNSLWEWYIRQIKKDGLSYYKGMVISAVAYHHNCFEEFELSPRENNFKMPKVSFDRHPLLALLILCDGVHNWGREMQINKSEIKFSDIECNNRDITFHLNLECTKSKASKIESDYKKYLQSDCEKAFHNGTKWKVNILFKHRQWRPPHTLALLG